MTRIDKAFSKMKNNPKNCSFQEIRTICEHFGCLVTPGGSHFSISHDLIDRDLTVPGNKNPVKFPYVKDVIKYINEIIELCEEDN
ncbi:hypothetical protein RD055328_08500 [Companilactobacillus sp. RD055328]|uniref:hypothetical protein n=1 Tax=Companilactobacillus sp. RD055328 TaxID=2916634 RepID=UPI001FC8E063|nr:hypothetical protein [Companilactobacillus sp. RD055328]GKQ42927.1 hypothetical protein RD055328_08500 [Companilactobacillus sp. RD055328]